MYKRLSDQDREAIHSSVSDALIRSKAPAELIAWHCEAANHFPKAIYYHDRAARANLQVMGFQNARFHAEAALRIGESIELSELEALRLELLAIRIELTSKKSSDYLERLEQLGEIAAEASRINDEQSRN